MSMTGKRFSLFVSLKRKNTYKAIRHDTTKKFSVSTCQKTKCELYNTIRDAILDILGK